MRGRQFLNVVGPFAKVQRIETEPHTLRLDDELDLWPKHLECFPDCDYAGLCLSQQRTVGRNVEKNGLICNSL
jgi:hypothetical protein